MRVIVFGVVQVNESAEGEVIYIHFWLEKISFVPVSFVIIFIWSSKIFNFLLRHFNVIM